MMTSHRKIVGDALSHRDPSRVPVDFGSTAVTGIHCRIVEQLREHYGLERRPVRIIEPLQMLGEVDEDLKRIIGVDFEGAFGRHDIFGIDHTRLHEQRTPWGQEVLIPSDIDLTTDGRGDIWIYPQGDRSAAPSGVLPDGCYFMNCIERGGVTADSASDPRDNLEEFGPVSESELDFYAAQVDKAYDTGRAVVASFGGTALGDVAYIPGTMLRNPKGIRSISEWYMAILLRPDYIHEVFSRQIDTAISNLQRLHERVGDKITVLNTCGTDFGSQQSQFCSVETFDQVWLPHYKKLNDWIHENTSWKVFKHTCGSMMPLLPSLLEAGFDIFNPVQINALNMDSHELKARFGDRLTFWGGGVDTQKILPFGTPGEVKQHVKEQIETFGPNGGFVFNAVHNVQANVPLENIVAVIDAVNEYR